MKVMPLIQMRDVPDHIYRQIEEQAGQERRSLGQQAVAILARGLRADLDPKERRRRVLQAVQAAGKKGLSRLSDPVKLIRKDRGR